MGNDVNTNSFRLFARPSFGQGVGTLIDFSGSLVSYNTSKTPEMADRDATAADWRAVGSDIEVAIKIEKSRK